jgi:hypothetical protein|uniref:Uncharacterized protein n=1 Tax=viral metagenome TaxID=1070528 RepID=A0A6C0IN46_9ZZZZ
MSFFYPNESKFIEGKIEFNYPRHTINNRDVEEKVTYSETMKKPDQYLELDGNLIDIKDKYYEISFQGRELQFQDLKMKSGTYLAKKMYIYNVLHHNISQYSNKNIVGEIVIEHENLGPKKSIVYTCFLLQNSKNSTTSSLDKVIKMIQLKNDKRAKIIQEDLQLNNVIPTQKEVIYYERLEPARKKHTYIFLKPIPVNIDTSEFLSKLTSSTSLFDTNAPMEKKYFSVDFTPTTGKNKKEGFLSMFSSKKEGMDVGDGYYLDCKPSGESEETTPGYVTPVNSEFTKSKSKTDGLQIVNDLLLFFIVVLTIFFTVPYSYKNFVIKPIFKQGGDISTYFNQVAGADIVLMFINVVILILFIAGGGVGLPNFFTMGMVWLLLIIMGSLVILQSKASNEYWRVKTGDDTTSPTEDFHNYKGLIAFLSILKDMLTNIPTLMTAAISFITGGVTLGILSVQKGLNPDQNAVASLLYITLTCLVTLLSGLFFFSPK